MNVIYSCLFSSCLFIPGEEEFGGLDVFMIQRDCSLKRVSVQERQQSKQEPNSP